jgi:hypothetical protein
MGATRVIVEQSRDEVLEVNTNSRSLGTFTGPYIDVTIGNVSLLLRDPATLDAIALAAMAGGLTLREELSRVTDAPEDDDDDDEENY